MSPSHHREFYDIPRLDQNKEMTKLRFYQKEKKKTRGWAVITISGYIQFSTQAFDPLPVTGFNANSAFTIPSPREKKAERLTPDAQLEKASVFELFS